MGLRPPPGPCSFLAAPVRIPNARKQGRRRDVLHEANGVVAPGVRDDDADGACKHVTIWWFRDMVAMAE